MTHFLLKALLKSSNLKVEEKQEAEQELKVKESKPVEDWISAGFGLDW